MSTKKYTIAVIIVNWNGVDDTVACLNSLERVVRGGNKLLTIVVDNGSTNNSVAVIRKQFPEVTLIENKTNLGFTGGNNVGMKFALEQGADLVWLLNNDTIVDKNVLAFTEAFEDKTVGASGSKIYFAPDHEYHHDRYTDSERGKVFWYAGGLVDWKNMYASHRGVDEVDHGQYNHIEQTPFITGCSFVIRSEVVRQVGLLDDAYFLYLEDLDWNVRMQKAGWKTMYTPTSVLWHVNAGSSGRPGNPLHEYYFTRNRLLLGIRYAPIRTKIALIREAIRFMGTASDIRKKAVKDWFFRRFGKQYEPTKHV
ncbi:MAG: glycosyltransferase family 2 protein [Microgenomates group bacterium]